MRARVARWNTGVVHKDAFRLAEKLLVFTGWSIESNGLVEAKVSLVGCSLPVFKPECTLSSQRTIHPRIHGGNAETRLQTHAYVQRSRRVAHTTSLSLYLFRMSDDPWYFLQLVSRARLRVISKGACFRPVFPCNTCSGRRASVRARTNR